MHWLTLPEPHKDRISAFKDVASARAWLAGQLQAQPLKMLGVLLEQIEAVDGATFPPATALELLNLLRTASIPIQENLESHYLRKALPMHEEDLKIFMLAQRCWTSLGIAYLRLAPHFPQASKIIAFHHAATSFRMAELAHFQAAVECPALLDRLLFIVLVQAEAANLLRVSIVDPDYPKIGKANIAGHLAWAFSLRLIDPYRLTAAQLVFANRALGRWRESASFQSHPEDDSSAREVNMSQIFGLDCHEGMPCWLNVRPIVRKIKQRLEALKAGETLDALKLGRELSLGVAMSLLREMDLRLNARRTRTNLETGDIEIAFGSENAYAVLKEELLNPPKSLDTTSATQAHERLAMFGFDQPANMPTAVQKFEVPTETWTLAAGKAKRVAKPDDIRRQSPCLIVSYRGGVARLGVMHGLQIASDGTLMADLDWYRETPEACILRRQFPQDNNEPRVPAFLSRGEKALSLILPASAGVRLETGIMIEGTTVQHLVPVDVIERGIDFVRYACRKT